ncbi:TPA: hypothetical protein I8Y16_004219 [Raoultella ornithinolytica]|nr:hypothetical protein [Raoultella ornithinolytica]HAT1670359.1 hypothetical protein [Raoultella ornithinolytica]
MNNRVVNLQDREEMREALDEAARHINLLQPMATREASSESGRIFFLWMPTKHTMPPGSPPGVVNPG